MVEQLEPRILASLTSFQDVAAGALAQRQGGQRHTHQRSTELSIPTTIHGVTAAATLLALPPMAEASNPAPALPVLQLQYVPGTNTAAPTVPVVRLSFPPVAAPNYDWHTQVVNGVLNIWAPDPTDFGATWAVTDPSALFGPTGVPNIQAVHQTAIPDCYLFAADAAVAQTNPNQIKSIVQNDTDGGWVVTFQYYSAGQYVPLRFHVSDTLSLALQQPADGQDWPLVIEKAYAAFRTWNGVNSTDTMASIGWGYPATSLTQLGEANQADYYTALSDQAFYQTLSSAVTAGEPILFQTSPTATTMVASHVYAITNVYKDSSGVVWVTTYNPWGNFETHSEAELRNCGIGSMVIGTA